MENTCGCRQCGGEEARKDAEERRLARRVVAYAAEIAARRGPDLRNRVIGEDVYTRLVMRVAAEVQ